MALGVCLALVATALNGYNDSGNVVATIVSSGAMPARRALLLAALAEFAGPFAFGSAVAATVGSGIVDPGVVRSHDVLVVLLATVLWGIGAWYLGLPTSASHALVGSLVGTAVVSAGPTGVQVAGLGKVALALLASPVLGLAVGYGLMKLTLYLAQGVTPRVNDLFRHGQVVASAALAVSHGTNNVQKWVGTLTLLLVAGRALPDFQTPLWALFACAACFALGTAAGGWRVMRTLGLRIYRIRPVHGFAAQTSTTGIILAASLLGGPVSTTHVASSSIVGAGAAERLSKVRWGLAGTILVAWVVTLPGAALLAALLHTLLAGVLGPA